MEALAIMKTSEDKTRHGVKRGIHDTSLVIAFLSGTIAGGILALNLVAILNARSREADEWVRAWAASGYPATMPHDDISDDDSDDGEESS